MSNLNNKEMAMYSEKNAMKVVSIDPAPSKDAVIFDGEFSSVPAIELSQYCADIAVAEDLLVCWDSPLTGPPLGQGASVASYSQRVIERFFSRSSTGYKAPGGISVLPYSGCPHWAITRACLGLPRLGKYDLPFNELPFHLTCQTRLPQPSGRWVAESHPAVAIWLWCRSASDSDDVSWVYKGSKSARSIASLWDQLVPIWRALGDEHIASVIDSVCTPKNDDELDAFVGWVLGTLYARGHASVAVLGDEATGGILLPWDDGLFSVFDEFKSGQF